MSHKLQVSILITTIIITLSIMLFFIIKNFSNNSNLHEMVKKYDVQVTTVDDKKANLNPNIVINAIDIKKLNESIIIVLDKDSTILVKEPQIIYKVQFNQDLFQFIFLKLIIKTFPQWKTNNFVFHFNALSNVVWVEYHADLNLDYLEWYFKITNKI